MRQVSVLDFTVSPHIPAWPIGPGIGTSGDESILLMNKEGTMISLDINNKVYQVDVGPEVIEMAGRCRVIGSRGRRNESVSGATRTWFRRG